METSGSAGSTLNGNHQQAGTGAGTSIGVVVGGGGNHDIEFAAENLDVAYVIGTNVLRSRLRVKSQGVAPDGALNASVNLSPGMRVERIYSDGSEIEDIGGRGLRRGPIGTGYGISVWSANGPAGPLMLGSTGQTVGFLGSTGAGRREITGSHGGNAALIQVLAHLADLGLITNSTTA